MKYIIIDDNINLLKKFNNLGFLTVFCNDKSDINDIKKSIEGLNQHKFDKILINISLITGSYSYKQNYGGFQVYKSLICHVRAEKWYLISFESESQLLNKIKDIESYDFTIINYIELTKIIGK